MNKTFKEQYQQDQNLQVGLANYWGYALEKEVIDNKQKERIQSRSPIIANITLRKFGKELSKTDKIKQIEDEIKGLENQKQMAKLNEEAIRNNKEGFNDKQIESQSPIIKMMDGKIKQYNYIVDHKHIMEKRSVESRKIMKMVNKTDLQQLLQAIHNQNILLNKADLKHQIIINKSIAQLYRQYKDRIKNQNKPNSKNQLNHSKSLTRQVPKQSQKILRDDQEQFDQIKWPNLFRFFSSKLDRVTHIPIISEIQEKYKQCSFNQGQNKTKIVNKFKEQQYKNQTTHKKYSKSIIKNQINPFIKQIQALKIKAENKKQLQNDINTPYVDKKDVELFKQMENKIRSSSEALDLLKNKFVDVCNKSKLYVSKQSQYQNKSFSKNQQEQQMHKRQNQLQEIIAKDIHMINLNDDSKNKFHSNKIMSNSRDIEKQKQQIFADLLKKRNNKFNKLCGTRVLVKYDSEKQARAMLKGQTDGVKCGRLIRDKQTTSRYYSSNDKFQKQIKGNQTTCYGQVESQINWKQKQANQQNYWRMCKNQKINLLLKRR